MIKNKNLSSEQKVVLFKEGTEPSGSSKLNHEKREGSFHCANCGVKLFESKATITFLSKVIFYMFFKLIFL